MPMSALVLAVGPTTTLPPLLQQPTTSWQTKLRPGSIEPIAHAAYRGDPGSIFILLKTGNYNYGGPSQSLRTPAGDFRSPGRVVSEMVRLRASPWSPPRPLFGFMCYVVAALCGSLTRLDK